MRKEDSLRKPRNPFMKPTTIFEHLWEWRAYRKSLEARDPAFKEMWKKRERANSALVNLIYSAIIVWMVYIVLVILWYFITAEGSVPRGILV